MPILASFAVPHPPLIIPDVGGGAENQIKKTIESYERVAHEIEKIKPETIIISSPHTIAFKDYFFLSSTPTMKGSFASFHAPNVVFEEKIDEELVKEIERLFYEESFPAGTISKEIELDHGTMVPLYFIRKYLSNYKIIVVGLSGLSLENHYHLGEIINQAVNNLNRRAVFIASGDLSHKLQEYGPYGYAKEGSEYERKILKTMTAANFRELLDYNQQLLEDAAECGHPSFTIMGGAWGNTFLTPTFLSHEDVTGVGYGVWTYYPLEDLYVTIAREAINCYIKTHRRIALPNNLPRELAEEQRGVFVSIHEGGELRGCIGTFLPVQSCVAKEIVENAIAAATQDPRFPPIEEIELDELEINVDVLTTPEKINSKQELDPKRYGVIVRNGYRRGLLLPDLEGINTVEEQISIAKRKAGIAEEEDVLLERFEVERHKALS